MSASINIDAHNMGITPQVRIYAGRSAVVSFKWQEDRYSGISLYFNNTSDMHTLISNLVQAFEQAERDWYESTQIGVESERV